MNHIFSLFMALTVTQLVIAQDEAGRPRMGRMHDGLLQELNLTDQQNKEIDKLRTDLMKQAIAQHAEIATARVEFLELLRADQPDKALLEKKMSQVAALESQTRMARLNHWFAVNKLLNADQQKVWKRGLLMRASMRHRGMADRGPRHRPLGGPPAFGRGRER